MEAKLNSEMDLKVLLKAVVFVNICLTTIAAMKYDVVFKNENVFSPCSGDNFVFFEEFLDMSELNFEYIDSESIYAYGKATFINDLGGGNVPTFFDVFKKNRGNWVSTIYNMHRPDMCRSAFNPLEFWYNYYTAATPKEDQTCPFRVGQALQFNVTSDLTIDVPSLQMQGEYKIRWTSKLGKINKNFCANIFVEVYKH